MTRMITGIEEARMNVDALKNVEALFTEQINNGTHPGAAMAIYRYGKLVLDFYGGISNTDTGEPVNHNSLYVLMSSTKPLAAACIALLKERNKLAYDDKVVEYWPEFDKNGKESITIRHILTHTAGIPETPGGLTWDKWIDWDLVVSAMAETTPRFEPGTAIAYHAINFGWLIAELVRRIDGRPFPQFLREEITNPLGMNDTYVGLPMALESRVCKMHAMEDSLDSLVPITFNRHEVHQSIVPGACGISTARDIARFYAMLERRGTLDGVQIFLPETVSDLTNLQIEGNDQTVNNFVRRTLGLMLGEHRMGSGGSDYESFGHGGAGTSICWANHRLGLAVTIITNGFRGAETNNARLYSLSKSIREACDP